MDETLWHRIITKIAIAILVITFVDLIYVNWWIIKSQKSEVKVQSGEQARIVEKKAVEPSPIVSPAPSARSESATKDAESKTVVERETQTIVQTAQKEIFIAIGSGSTQNNNYEDLAGLEVTVDTNKYPAIESVVFEGSIWVQDGNGKMYAQLYNAQDKHPVWGSEISTSSSKGVLTTSGSITLEKGARTYRVQAKTNLSAYAAHVENARIKITLR